MELNFKNAVKKYAQDGQKFLDNFQIKLDKSTDPLGTLFSPEGQAFLNLLPGADSRSSVLKQAVLYLDKELRELSKGEIYLSDLSNEESLKVRIKHGNKSIIEWYPMINKVTIIPYERIGARRLLIKDLQDQKKAKEIELNEAQIIVNSDNALLNNEYYVAAIKKFLTKKKYKQQAQGLIDNLTQDVVDIQTAINTVEQEISLLSISAVSDTINTMKKITAAFPHGVEPKTYSRYRYEKYENPEEVIKENYLRGVL